MDGSAWGRLKRIPDPEETGLKSREQKGGQGKKDARSLPGRKEGTAGLPGKDRRQGNGTGIGIVKAAGLQKGTGRGKQRQADGPAGEKGILL